MLRGLIIVLAVVLAAAWIIAGPGHAGDDVHQWITGILTFFRHATSG